MQEEAGYADQVLAVVLLGCGFRGEAGARLFSWYVWTVSARRWRDRRADNTILQKEKSFYDRIRQKRADPSSSSPQNPIPDYYGEKIASVKDYRRWMKDQRAFKLKKNKNLF